ncbi:MAG: cupredoxin domain-containing protein [Calditrichaeota bacterium]|nr:cupredoxin domain-containing protein [Calditrichota bacterium]
MRLDQIIVTISGLFLAAGVIWYFFLYKRQTVRAKDTEGIQEVKISVKGGYDPDLIVVKKDKTVRLNFYREETSSCTEVVVFPDFRVRKELPAFQNTIIEIMPDKIGEYDFHCDMNMIHGKLIVEE